MRDRPVRTLLQSELAITEKLVSIENSATVSSFVTADPVLIVAKTLVLIQKTITVSFSVVLRSAI